MNFRRRNIPLKITNHFLSRLCGIWVYDPSTPIFVRILFNIYKIIVYTIIMVFFVTLLVHLILNRKSLLVVTDDGCYLAGIFLIMFKLYNFNKKNKKIMNFIENVYQPVDIIAQSRDAGVQMHFNTMMLQETVIMSFFCILAAFLVIALVVFVPKPPGELPITASFPFNTKISPGHEVAVFFQAAAVSYGLYAIVAMDSLVINACRCLCLQITILASNYEKCDTKSYRRCKLGPICRIPSKVVVSAMSSSTEDHYAIQSYIPFTRDERWDVNDSFFKRFETCKRHHQRMINIVDELNDIFGSSMFAQICSSFSMICLAGFQAVLGADSKNGIIKFLIYLGAAMSQLVNWCYSGNVIIYMSSSLHDSQWQSGWEDQLDSRQIKTLMLMSMMRAKKPLQLRAGNYYSMSMHTLIAILRNSYSFFALLRTVSEA